VPPPENRFKPASTPLDARAVRLAPLFLALSASAAVGCAAPGIVEPPKPAPATSAPPPAPPPAPAESSPVQIDPRIVQACGDIPKPQFGFDSSSVSADASATLAAIARCFTDGNLKGRTLKLVGHADARGETMYNLALGQRRAATVGEYLHGKGLPQQQMLASSRGEFDATGTDEAGWARDRRVDLMLDGDAPAAGDGRPASGEWVPASDGVVPDGALIGGEEAGRRFVVCRAQHAGGNHPGKLVDKTCNIPVGGLEVAKSEYQVLVVHGRSEWVAARDGAVPARAVKAGSASGKDFYLCRAKHEGGTHPGKVVEKACDIPLAGKEVSEREYEVLTFP
jgi:peptidoglycan-associated lipoprotein